MLKKYGAVLAAAFLFIAGPAYASVVQYNLPITTDSGVDVDNISAGASASGYVFGTDPTTGHIVELGLPNYFTNTGTSLNITGLIADKVVYNGEPLGYKLGLMDTATGTLATNITAVQGNLTSFINFYNLNGFNPSHFFGNVASTSQFLASSTPGLMSSSMVTQLSGLMAASTTLKTKAYEGTTLRTGAFPIFLSASVTTGVAVVNLTSDGTGTGTALCSGIIKDSVSVIFNDSGSSFQQSWAWSNSDKTLTVTANKFTTANILSGILGQAAANTSVAKVTVWCY